MNGQTIKDALRREGRQLSELADYLGVSQQNLSSILNKESVKTSTLEGAAAFLGKPIGYFYGEGNTATASGDGSTAVAGGTINDSILIEEIAAQRKLTALAMEQNGQLLRIIDNLTKK